MAERITAGATAAFAVPLNDAGWELAGSELPEWDGDRSTGTVPIVAGAPVADVLLLARTGDGEVLVAVDRGDDGVGVAAQQPLDLTATVGAVTLTEAAGEVLADGAELRADCKRPSSMGCWRWRPIHWESARGPWRWP